MNFLKLKSILFGLIAVFAVTALLTSCEQETLNNLEEELALQNIEENMKLRGANKISWKVVPKNLSTGRNDLKVNYSLDKKGIILAEIFDSNWKRVGKYSITINAGSGNKTLPITGGNLSEKNNHLEIKILDRNWNQIGAKLYKKLNKDSGNYTPVGPSTGNNELSWKSKPTTVKNGLNDVKVKFSLKNKGLIMTQIFDCNWKKVGQFVNYANAGSGTRTLPTTASNLCSKDNFIQVKLMDRNWKELVPKLQVKVRKK